MVSVRDGCLMEDLHQQQRMVIWDMWITYPVGRAIHELTLFTHGYAE